MLAYFFQGSALGIAAGTSPGPLQTYLISKTLSGGWRHSIPLIFVPLFSDTPVILLTLFVLNKLSDKVIDAVSIVGGIFVFYMAWGLWKEWRKDRAAADLQSTEADENYQEKASKDSVGFWKTVVMNLLNPNPYIYWTFVMGPILADAIAKSWLHAFSFLFGFYFVFLGTMIITIIIFHLARRLGVRFVSVVQLVSVLILVVFGGVLLQRGLFGLFGLT